MLDAGDGALFYSDGLVEAHDPNGEMFGFPRLRALVAKHGEGRSLGHFLLEELYSFVGEAGSRRTTSPSSRPRRVASLLSLRTPTFPDVREIPYPAEIRTR